MRSVRKIRMCNTLKKQICSFGTEIPLHKRATRVSLFCPDAVTQGVGSQHGRKISPVGGMHPAEYEIMHQKFVNLPDGVTLDHLASFDSSSDLGLFASIAV